MNESAAGSLSRFIAWRYVSGGQAGQLVSFMSAIAVVGLALGVAILLTVLSVMNGFEREMRDHILGIVPHVTIVADTGLSAASWTEVADHVSAQPLVSAVAPVIQRPGVVTTDQTSRGVLVQGIAARTEGRISLLHRFMRSGSLQQLAETRWGMVLGQGLAEQLGVETGDRLALYSPDMTINPLTPLAIYRQFEVTGIFRVGTRQLDNELVLINLAAARALFRLRSPHNGLRVKVMDPLQADELVSQLNQVLPAGITPQSWTRQLGTIYNNIRFSRNLISFLLWLLIAVATFNLVVSLLMIVRDKRADIAILRTLGASPRLIHRIFLWQGCLIGLIGLAAGLLLGVFGALQAGNLATWIERRFAVQLLDPEVYPIDFLPSKISITDMLTVVCGVLLLCLLATWYPARRAAAVQPARALRAD